MEQFSIINIIFDYLYYNIFNLHNIKFSLVIAYVLTNNFENDTI